MFVRCDRVVFERTLGPFSYDTQNSIFDYETIWNTEAYCATKDPLYDKNAPCGDLQAANATTGNGTSPRPQQRRSRRRGSSTTAAAAEPKSAPMFALDDVARALEIAKGWPTYDGGGEDDGSGENDDDGDDGRIVRNK